MTDTPTVALVRLSPEDPRARQAVAAVRARLEQAASARTGWPEGFTVTEYSVAHWLTLAPCDAAGNPYPGAMWRVRDDGLVLQLSSSLGIHGAVETEEVLRELGDAPADPADVVERIAQRTRRQRST
jgi:hypothetical protein